MTDVIPAPEKVEEEPVPLAKSSRSVGPRSRQLTGIGEVVGLYALCIAGALTVGDLNLASGTGSYAGVTVAAIPEPSAALLGLVACGFGVLRRRRSA